MLLTETKLAPVIFGAGRSSRTSAVPLSASCLKWWVSVPPTGATISPSTRLVASTSTDRRSSVGSPSVLLTSNS